MENMEMKDATPAAAPKRQRRSKLDRLQDEKQRLLQRLEATKQKRLAIEEELRQAEAQAKLLRHKAHARDTLLVGSAFLRLLEQGDSGAHGLKAAVLKITDKAGRARVWQALALHSQPVKQGK